MTQTIVQKLQAVLESLGEAREERANLAQRHLDLRVERGSVIDAPRALDEVRDEIAHLLVTERVHLTTQLREWIRTHAQQGEVAKVHLLTSFVGGEVRGGPSPIMAATACAMLADVLDDAVAGLTDEWPKTLTSAQRAARVDALDRQIAEVEEQMRLMDAAAREANLPL